MPVAMAQSNLRTTPILPPSTPLNPSARPPPSQQPVGSQPRDKMTPSSDSRMNPPSVPRSLVTPSRDMRESSVMSAASSVRKPRQNLDERDHILMLKHCYDQRHNFKEGNKTQFWTAVNTLFQQDTGKVLAQMSATVGRLVESRRRQVADWENGVIPQKPGGELNEKLDRWIEFLKIEDGEGEAERMRQVEGRRRMEESRKEARRQALASEAAAAQIPTARMVSGPQPVAVGVGSQPQHLESSRELVQVNGEPEMNGYRPNKRKRREERPMVHESQAQTEQNSWQVQQQQQPQPPPLPQYTLPPPPEPTRRVIVEGALTKEDWRDIMGNDARLRALESKVDRIELIVSQNNKLLLQLIQSQSKDRDRDMDRNNEEDRVPVHLDAEFERDYL